MGYSQNNPFGHNITYETFKAWGGGVAQGVLGDSSQVWFVRCECECGWHGYWKFPTSQETEPQTHHIVQLVQPRTAHDDQIGLVTAFG